MIGPAFKQGEFDPAQLLDVVALSLYAQMEFSVAVVFMIVIAVIVPSMVFLMMMVAIIMLVFFVIVMGMMVGV